MHKNATATTGGPGHLPGCPAGCAYSSGISRGGVL